MIITLMLNLKFKLLEIYITNRPSKVPTITYSIKTSMKQFVAWRCLVFILSEEVNDDIHSST